MATGRGTRALVWPAARTKICPASPSYGFRAKSFATDKQDRDGDDRSTTTSSSAGVKSDGTPLGQQLAAMDIEPEEYKRLWRSKQASMKRMAEWEPRTRDEAQKKWKEMQAAPDHLTLLHMYKRAGLDVLELAKERGISLPTDKPPLDSPTQTALDQLRSPLNVQAVHLRPLRRAAEHGVPVCDVQLRSYSVRSLLFFADFAVRAAYYMGLPARGPIPLPRITERWTVPRANFIFKKSQENFERITMRRLIQIQDGHGDVVKAWLAFLHKHQYHGVGVKANIWEYESLHAATRAGYALAPGDHSRRREGAVLQKVEQILGTRPFGHIGEKEEEGGSQVELRP